VRKAVVLTARAFSGVARGVKLAAKPLSQIGSHEDTKMMRKDAASRDIFVSLCEP
jgi:hypothetical protein